MATLNEIAFKTNVSPSTVSRVLNFDKTLSISNDKRKLIFEVAEELEYETPRNRRKSKKLVTPKYNIGLLHFLSVEDELNDPYFISIRLGIEKKANEKGMTIFKTYQPSSISFKQTLINLDGVILVGKFKKEDIEVIESLCKNIVFVDFEPKGKNYNCIISNIGETTKKQILFLLEQGISRIGYMGGVEDFSDSKAELGEIRHDTFVKVMKKNDLYREDWVYIESFTNEDGYNMMKKALLSKDIPQAFVMGTDNTAIGALRAIYEAGLTVPNDISIIGVNDNSNAQYTIPPLTTVKIYSEHMGECAVELMLDLLKGLKIAKKIVVGTDLIIRDSVKLK